MQTLGPTEMHLLLALQMAGGKVTSSQILPLLGLTYLNISRRHALWRLIENGLVYESWRDDSCAYYVLTANGVSFLQTLSPTSNLTTQ